MRTTIPSNERFIKNRSAQRLSSRKHSEPMLNEVETSLKRRGEAL